MRTVFKDGYSWVEIPDAAWKRAEFCDYIQGMEIG